MTPTFRYTTKENGTWYSGNGSGGKALQIILDSSESIWIHDEIDTSKVDMMIDLDIDTFYPGDKIPLVEVIRIDGKFWYSGEGCFGDSIELALNDSSIHSFYSDTTYSGNIHSFDIHRLIGKQHKEL